MKITPAQLFCWTVSASLAYLLICSIIPSLGERHFIHPGIWLRLFWMTMLITAAIFVAFGALGWLTWARIN